MTQTGTPFQRIAAAAAEVLLARSGALVVDIRDAASFAQGHIAGARQAGTADLPPWLMQSPRANPVLVCCYHGISSQEYARLLAMLGFREVYSLDGGYEAWRAHEAARRSAPGGLLSVFLQAHGFPDDGINATIANGATPLMMTSRFGLGDIARALVALHVDLEARNNDGNTALWLACYGNHITIIDLLIAAGIDVDNQNDNGATCLMYAASAGKSAVVERLLRAGARTDLQSLDGFTALDMAATIECLGLLRGKRRIKI